MSDFFFKKKKGQILRYLFIDVARMLELNTFEINMLKKKRGGWGRMTRYTKNICKSLRKKEESQQRIITTIYRTGKRKSFSENAEVQSMSQ